MLVMKGSVEVIGPTTYPVKLASNFVISNLTVNQYIRQLVPITGNNGEEFYLAFTSSSSLNRVYKLYVDASGILVT